MALQKYGQRCLAPMRCEVHQGRDSFLYADGKKYGLMPRQTVETRVLETTREHDQGEHDNGSLVEKPNNNTLHVCVRWSSCLRLMRASTCIQ